MGIAMTEARLYGTNSRVVEDAQSIRLEMIRLFKAHGVSPKMLKYVNQVAEVCMVAIIEDGRPLDQRFEGTLKDMAIGEIKRRQHISEANIYAFYKKHGRLRALIGKLLEWDHWCCVKQFNHISRQL